MHFICYTVCGKLVYINLPLFSSLYFAVDDQTLQKCRCDKLGESVWKRFQTFSAVDRWFGILHWCISCIKTVFDHFLLVRDLYRPGMDLEGAFPDKSNITVGISKLESFFADKRLPYVIHMSREHDLHFALKNWKEAHFFIALHLLNFLLTSIGSYSDLPPPFSFTWKRGRYCGISSPNLVYTTTCNPPLPWLFCHVFRFRCYPTLAYGLQRYSSEVH